MRNFYSFILSVLTAAAFAFSANAETVPTIFGSVIYSPAWEGSTNEYGMYSFPAQAGTQLSTVKKDTYLVANGGGVYADGKYIFVSYEKFMGNLFTDLYVYDCDNWSKLQDKFGQAQWIATDMTYDATDGKIYGCFYNDNADGYCFGTLDVELGELSWQTTVTRTKIADLDEALNGVAADKFGNIFAITLSGNLVKVDKATGALTTVGSTGIVPKYNTSATFDNRTNTLYWIAMVEGMESTLYKVDTATAQVTEVSKMPNNEEVCGIFIPFLADDNAPAAATDATAVFENGGRTGKISFTVPATTYGGDALAGEVSYTISSGSTVLEEGTATAGTEVQKDITVSADGEYVFTIVLSNASGKSPKANTEPVYVGRATPKAPQNVVLSKISDSQLKLTWDAVTEASGKGYFNPADVTYTVTRLNDGTVVADGTTETEHTDNISYETITSFSYKVIANHGGKTSETTSNNIVVGSVQIPFECDFESPEQFKLFTVIDVIGDGKTWESGYGMAEAKYSSTNPKDDYLVTPPMKMKAGMRYKVSYDVSCASASYPEKMELRFGDAPAADALTVVVAEERTYNNAIAENEEHFFTAPADGDFHLAWHATSDAGMYNIRLDNIKVEADAMASAPAEVGGFKVVCGEDGLSPVISFTAPEKTVDGQDLASISKIEILRNGEVIKTFDNPAPGAELTYTDTDETLQGNTEYTVIPYNEDGNGGSATVTVFLGVDTPKEPENIKLADNGDGTVTLSWDAPAEGKNGGYLGNITYNITTDGGIIEEYYTGTSLVITPVISERQEIIQYSVQAVTSGGESYITPSEVLLFGEPYNAPFKESFASALYSTFPWVETHEASYAVWTATDKVASPAIEAQDGDGGFIYYAPSYYTNYHAVLYSPKVGVSGCTNPTLSFYVYKIADINSIIDVKVSADNGEFESVKEVIINDLEGDGWTKVTVPLAAYKDSGFIRVAFDAYATSTYKTIAIDNIHIFDLVGFNLAATGITADRKIKVGETGKISATVSNEGANAVAAADYSVELYLNGELYLTAEGKDLLPEQSASFDFAYTPDLNSPENLAFSAKTVMDKDEIESDNQTGEAAAAVVFPNYPAATGLRAESAGQDVVLSWNAPESTTVPAAPVVEDFESYDSFIIDNIGDWKVYDVDRKMTNGITGTMYDHAGEEMAFQVFAPAEVTGSALTKDRYLPHSGEKYAVAWCALYGTNDDWLVSPELAGIAQTIEFWVGSINSSYGNETFEVWYSATTDELESFVKIDDASGEADQIWKKVSADLPDGAKYFAIRCTSPDRYAFKVDDISFISASSAGQELTIAGYNVYRDGVKLNAEPVAETTYTDNVDYGTYTYKVTVVYDAGESVYSEGIEFEHLSGVGSLDGGNAAAFGKDGKIAVRNALGKIVSVYSLSGTELYSHAGAQSMEIEAEAGAYIVKIGQKAVKVIVK